MKPIPWCLLVFAGVCWQGLIPSQFPRHALAATGYNGEFYARTANVDEEGYDNFDKYNNVFVVLGQRQFIYMQYTSRTTVSCLPDVAALQATQG